MIGAVVLAGGQGKRMGAGINKQYLEIEGRSVLSLAIESMAAMADEIIVVAAQGEDEMAARAIAESGIAMSCCLVVHGGRERQDSVRHALMVMPPRWEKVLIHDGARPFVPRAVLECLLAATVPGIGAIPGTAVTDTIKRIDAEGFVVETPPRDQLRAAQTPQCFMAQEIRALHLAAAESQRTFTDDAMLYEDGGMRVRMVDGSAMSRKLTVRDDLLWAVEMKHIWEAQKQ